MGNSRERIDYKSEVVDLFDESTNKLSSDDFEDVCISSGVYEPVLVGLNDRKLAFHLDKDFYPQYDNEITVRDAGGKSLTIPVSDLQFLAFVNQPLLIKDLKINSFSEVVEIYSGDSYEIRVPVDQNFDAGLYGVINEPSDRYKYIFVTFNNIRIHYQSRPIGEIIVEKHILSQDVMQNVLRKQVQLRNLRLGAIIAKKINLPHREVEKILQQAQQGKSGDSKKNLGNILIESGLISPEEMNQSLAFQKKIRAMKIGRLLIEMGHIDEIQIYKVLAEKFRKRFVNLQDIIPAEEALRQLPHDLINKLPLIPIDFRNKRLIIATSYPDKAEISDVLRKKISCPFELVVSPHNQIADLRANLQFHPN